jgi:hypothetical protein
MKGKERGGRGGRGQTSICPIGKPISARRIFSTKSESDQGSPPKNKRASAFLGDLLPKPAFRRKDRHTNPNWRYNNEVL